MHCQTDTWTENCRPGHTEQSRRADLPDVRLEDVSYVHGDARHEGVVAPVVGKMGGDDGIESGRFHELQPWRVLDLSDGTVRIGEDKCNYLFGNIKRHVSIRIKHLLNGANNLKYIQYINIS